jgi:hypothetical protein
LTIRRTPIARYGARHLHSADCLRGRITAIQEQAIQLGAFEDVTHGGGR